MRYQPHIRCNIAYTPWPIALHYLFRQPYESIQLPFDVCIIPYFVAFVKKFLKIFWWVFDFYREKQDPNKEPLQACLSFLPFEERCRSHQVFPCCQNIDLLSASVLTVSRTFKQCRTNHNGWRMVGHPAAHQHFIYTSRASFAYLRLFVEQSRLALDL